MTVEELRDALNGLIEREMKDYEVRVRDQEYGKPYSSNIIDLVPDYGAKEVVIE